MAAQRLVYKLHDERALRRERGLLDRTNPMELYSDSEVIERFSFRQADTFDINDELYPQLRHFSDRRWPCPRVTV